MDKFAALEPVKLYNAPTPVSSKFPRFSIHHKPPAPFQLVGRLPVDIHILILTYAAIPDIPSLSRISRAYSNLCKDERVWEARWLHLASGNTHLASVLDDLENRTKTQNAVRKSSLPPTLSLDGAADDDFGDFTSVNAPPDEMGDFVGAFSTAVITSPTNTSFTPQSAFRTRYIRAHNLLKTLIPALSSPTYTVLTALFPAPEPSLSHQAHTLRLLSTFLSHKVKPVRAWEKLSAAIRAASDRFDDGLLTAFDTCDSKNDEEGMKQAAQASWDVWDGSSGHWELARAWADKREIFYDQTKWHGLDNFTNNEQLDFDAMDAFMSHVLDALREHGTRAVRVFPPEANVLLSFSDRLANEVVAEYLSPLLDRAREASTELFLKAIAASFKESWRMVDVILEVSKARPEAEVSRTRAEDVIFKMFESNMDEYLDEEVEVLKQAFEVTCRTWEKTLSDRPAIPTSAPDQARFLGSHNPAQVKRTVLASFTDVLLLPVTIVPKTTVAVGKAFGAALTTGGNAAVQGISMLNPQRWGATSATPNDKNGYISSTSGSTLFEIGDDGDDDESPTFEKSHKRLQSSVTSTASISTVATTTQSTSNRSLSVSSASTRATTPVASASASQITFDKFDLLLSLDTALELIHADRESLKRVETFAGYPGHYGHRVRDTIEEIFVLCLQALGERHIKVGFERAIEQMRAYRPADHEETSSVAPLMQFFELVHVGDTMQSMVQVYFDKELSSHIDRTDFLNSVVREKKRFEDTLDDSVAGGLNAGTDALMSQVEHIILKLTKPREYYPADDAAMDLGPSQGCTESIKCLQMHCQLLKGSTSKEVLEVFYQEIGLRLIAILQKHIKRQIISLNGGFQVIADLNAYHAFITSLKIPTIISDFSYLKMLGHVYVVEDAKDLAQIVRDVTRYGGAYRPEDIYEFIQRRSDWKKIEKTVDKAIVVGHKSSAAASIQIELCVPAASSISFSNHHLDTYILADMAPTEFSLRLQHGITGGFAPPTPNAVFTVTGAPSLSFLQVTTSLRPSGTPSLQDALPKEVVVDDNNRKLVDELYNILKSIPTESPPGSEDIYGLDTSIAFGSEDLQWMNGGPSGCGGGTSEVQATDGDKTKFRRAVDIVKELVGHEGDLH
ncbi:F-box protein: endocytic membrane traffic, recycling ReCYcling 1 [Steccherinum ochraceum]|uniref:F-box protein: endocytic membrane traffic, recycling ReCYcling 1 n=1 Tax=Steccherinum ochraceum TaxID=92696 RepID=A0A4R0RPX5_9APHY|nr:F-box protein: endocytic membrane traffic, recycling ReCYcling 1 [Steccherinum ochraceum]